MILRLHRFRKDLLKSRNHARLAIPSPYFTCIQSSEYPINRATMQRVIIEPRSDKLKSMEYTTIH